MCRSTLSTFPLALVMVLYLVTGLPAGVVAQRVQKETVDSTVVGLAASCLNQSHVVGFSVGIVRNGQNHVYHFGEVEKGTNDRPTMNTMYAIGSITKTFAATLMAQAVLENKIRLEDDIRLYLDGDFPNLEFEGQPIQVIHLLNHVSGLPRVLFDLPESAPADFERLKQLTYTRQDFYRDLRRVKLESAPGARFVYSNAGGQLVGYILERIYGKTFEQLVAEKITRPLGMNQTKITLNPAEKPRFRGYDKDGSLVPENPDQIQASGALKSTVADMLKYAAWHLAETDEAVKLTHEPRLNLVNNYWIGLNWQMFRLPDYRVIWQQGSMPGFTSYLVLYPGLDLAIVVLANEYDPATADRLTEMVKQITKKIEPRASDLP